MTFSFTCREGWQDQLKDLISKLNISVAFDCIAGDMSGTMMQVFLHRFHSINMININIIVDIFLDQCRHHCQRLFIQLLPNGSTTICYGSLSVGLVLFLMLFILKNDTK